MQKPTLGRIVLVVGRQAKSNGADVAPGIITRVFGEHPDGGHVVNVTTFPDGLNGAVAATSTRLVGTEDEARALLPATAAYWPPRS